MKINKVIRNTLFGAATLATICVCAVNVADNIGSKVYAAEPEKTENAVSKDEADSDRIYGIGSVSKVYVTTAVMQLVDQGKVELDSPITEYIEDFSMADNRYKDITVRMLMNHTSGIAGTSGKNAFLYGDNDFVSTDFVLENLKTQKLKADPGEYAAYCNDGFELLEIIVERVTGMSFTDYVDKNIADKIGAKNIYTGKNVFNNPALADIYPDGHNKYETEYVMFFGSGGIYSTAADTCEFGSAFFKGDNRLLSEKSKNEMATLWSSIANLQNPVKYDASCMDQNGLGWDLVDIPMYEEAGVKALWKGGDSQDYHASLLVLPEEEISVCVTSAEGSSSFNMAMSEALANIALEEQGIIVEETKASDVELKETVPDSYKKYEGLYVFDGVPAEISFPDMKYALVKELGSGTSDNYFMYTDIGFVRVTGDVDEGNFRQDPDFYCFNIVETEGNVYLTKEIIRRNSGLITSYNKTYSGEKLEANPLSEDVLKIWQERERVKCEIVSEKYSSALYNSPFMELHVLGDSGYAVNDSLSNSVMKITDANHLECVSTIPSSSNRDLMVITVDGDGTVHSTNGFDMVKVSDNERFTSDVKEVHLTTDKAVWFNIDDSMANKTISLERPEKSAVYVYDKFGKVKYSTHMTEYGNIIALPQDGYIMFAGETGDTITIY